MEEKALEWLAEGVFDPLYGARPLKRVIQRTLQDPLALKLLDGSLLEGSIINVSCDRDGLVIKT
jgi:ATP-dependent Clp protease ATP-binding subunit ClpB